MVKGVHFFSQERTIPSPVSSGLLGIPGRRAAALANWGFPVLPGIILDTGLMAELGTAAPEETAEIGQTIKAHLDACARIMGKRYGDRENPLLLTIEASSNLAVSHYPSLRNAGLARSGYAGFAGRAGEAFADRALAVLIQGALAVEARIQELEGHERARKRIEALRDALGRHRAGALKRGTGPMDACEGYVPQGFFAGPDEQLMAALRSFARLLALDDQNDRDTALLIRPLIYGGYGDDSYAGVCFSRNPISGEKRLEGECRRINPEGLAGEGAAAANIPPRYRKVLQRIASTLEDACRDIRRIVFAVEQGCLWIIEQGPAERRSVQADIALLLDLVRRRVIDTASAVKAVEPLRLNEILHPLINPQSAAALPSWKGGIAGAPGAAIGRVCFSTNALLEARKRAQRRGEDCRFILVLTASFAGDVKAIEVSAGVLTAEGGYAAHASVVARQYGKVSLVAPALRFQDQAAFLGGLRFAQGDYITLDAPFYGESSVYQGKAELIDPNPAESGLFDFIALCRESLRGFQVRANAETPQDARLALSFGAEGIGLCRTEHLFLGADRINVFRELILAASAEERKKALRKLQRMQRGDFYALLKIMAGKEVAVRLLDAPLHEFLPHNEQEFSGFLAHLEKGAKNKADRAALAARFASLEECNPMLGRRGCRIAVSYPEIYAMQIQAVFEAAYALWDEQVDARPEILIPLVMNASELKLIAYGKKIEGASYAGIVEVEEALREAKRGKSRGPGRFAPYGIGVMIELPAAALGAAELAKYARFFSFGTNDLTQTVLGVSRDDCAAFMPDYTRFDLIDGDPFSTLDPRVKELIALAVERGRLTRPDLVCGLCGEHGANPANIRFCLDAGIDYVSCSPYSVPIALLAAAQAELDRAAGG